MERICAITFRLYSFDSAERLENIIIIFLFSGLFVCTLFTEINFHNLRVAVHNFTVPHFHNFCNFYLKNSMASATFRILSGQPDVAREHTRVTV
jgi:hypothetical protein